MAGVLYLLQLLHNLKSEQTAYLLPITYNVVLGFYPFSLAVLGVLVPDQFAGAFYWPVCLFLYDCSSHDLVQKKLQVPEKWIVATLNNCLYLAANLIGPHFLPLLPQFTKLLSLIFVNGVRRLTVLCNIETSQGVYLFDEFFITNYVVVVGPEWIVRVIVGKRHGIWLNLRIPL